MQTSMLEADREDLSVAKATVSHGASGEKTVRNSENERRSRVTGVGNKASGRYAHDSGVVSGMTDNTDNLRRRFLSKIGCDSGDRSCDNHFHVPRNSLVEPKLLNAPVHTSQNNSPDSRAIVSKEVTNSYLKVKTSDMNMNYNLRNSSKRTLEREKESLNTSKPLFDLAGTEFSEAEREFEPLYLREDDSYDLIDGSLTTIAAPVTEKVKTTSKSRRNTSRLTEEQLRNLPVCPEIPPGLCKSQPPSYYMS